jgi:hypothetical protein
LPCVFLNVENYSDLNPAMPPAAVHGSHFTDV